jgi:integrase
MINGHPGRPDHFNERELEVFYNAECVPLDQRLTAHELRHTCGTLLYQDTKDIYHVSTFLGHSDVSVTSKIYIHSAFSEEPIHVENSNKVP